jgi:Tfp pilus assembly protein PilO
MATMSNRERRLIALAVAVALAIGGWLFLVEPIRERNRTTAELLPAREQILAKRRALIARAPALRQDLEQTTQRVEQIKGRLLAAAAPPVAASELVKIVKDTAIQARLEVRSERILAPVSHGELLEVPVEITVSGGIRELVTMLYGLDAVGKILTLQDLKIRVLNVSQPKELLTTVMVSGFILPKPAAPRPAAGPKQS